MNIAVDPEAGFFTGRSSGGIGNDEHPNVASFVALTNAFEADESRILVGESMQNLRQFLVSIESVELDLGHPCSPFVFFLVTLF
ncbi:MAG: hypothetical protein R2856_38165 [Caldilineaceae bacterium]